MRANREFVLGYAPTRRDTFPDPKHAIAQRDPIRKRVEEIIAAIPNVRIANIDWLNEEGLLVENADAERAAKFFQAEGVDALFVPHCNFGQEEAVGKIVKALNKPTLLWGPRDARPPANFIERQTDVQCGLFASGKALRRYGVPFTYIENCWLDSPVLDQGIEHFLRVANVVRSFRGMRIGQFCVRPYQFLTVKVNESELLEKFGIEVVPLNSAYLVELVEDVLKNRADEVNALSKEYRDRNNCDAQSTGEMNTMAAMEIAFEEVADNMGLAAIATECWDVFREQLGVKPCFVMGNLTEKGLPVVCETDIHGAITSVLLTAAARGDSPTFLADVTIRHPDNDNAELLWHCGPYPRGLAKEGSNPAVVGWHGQWELKGGDVTIARFDLEGTGQYRLFADHARGVDGPSTHGNYIWIETDNWPKWERKFVCGPYIHHVTGIHGKYAGILKDACNYLPHVQYDNASMEV